MFWSINLLIMNGLWYVQLIYSYGLWYYVLCNQFTHLDYGIQLIYSSIITVLCFVQSIYSHGLWYCVLFNRFTSMDYFTHLFLIMIYQISLKLVFRCESYFLKCEISSDKLKFKKHCIIFVVKI